MIVQIGKRTGSAQYLLSVPDTYIVNFCSSNHDEAGAEWLIPMRGCAQFVSGNIREACGRLTATEIALWIGRTGRIRNI